MALQRVRLLSLLRRAIHKVRLLLSFDLQRWLLSSAAGSRSRHGLESRPRSPGLLGCAGADEYSHYLWDTAPPPSPATETSASPPRLLVRKISRAASGSSASSDDINQRAEDFIVSFYRQLRMERQISLRLRYCKGNEGGFLETTKPNGG